MIKASKFVDVNFFYLHDILVGEHRIFPGLAQLNRAFLEADTCTSIATAKNTCILPNISATGLVCGLAQGFESIFVTVTGLVF